MDAESENRTNGYNNGPQVGDRCFKALLIGGNRVEYDALFYSQDRSLEKNVTKFLILQSLRYAHVGQTS